MAFTEASADDLTTRFPRFAEVAEATIDVHLGEARRLVDGSWCDEDQVLGQLLYAAHSMTLDGLGTGTEAELAAEGLGDVQSLKSGSLSFTRKSGSGDGDAAGELASTTYGRRFMELLQRNRGGARVTPSGSIPYYPLYPSRIRSR